MTLDILGDGPMRAALEAQSRDLRIDEYVTFHGMVPHSEVAPIGARSNMLLFASICEFGGGAVLEAMALGLVSIVIDYASPGELVSPQTSYKIPIGPRADIIEGMKAALSEIIADPTVLREKSDAARARVEDIFIWPKKARQMETVYAWVLNGRSGLVPSVF